MSLAFPKRRILILIVLLGVVVILLAAYNQQNQKKQIPPKVKRNVIKPQDDSLSKEDRVEEEDDDFDDTSLHIDPSSEEPSKQWKEWRIHPNSPSTKKENNHTIARLTVKKHVEGNPKPLSGIVSLATQSTVNWLHHVVEVSHNWRAPMSVAVYVPGLEFVRAKILIWLLYRCSDIASSSIVFQLVYPFDTPPMDNLAFWKGIDSNSCGDIKTVTESLNTTKHLLDYPQNFMRNIARYSCETNFSILADNDMIPSPGLAQDLQPVLRDQESCKQCAFVIPVYEISNAISHLPENKPELLKLIGEKLAQPFHWKAWKHNQGSHNPLIWEELTPTNQLHVAYAIYKYHLYYEPIYVAKQDVTPFDERFQGYGYTRNSQVFQMIVEGYRFYVLDPGFFMHRGFKRKNSNPKWRDKENYRNLDIFFGFAKEHLIKRGYEKAAKRLDQDRGKQMKRKRLARIVASIDNFSEDKKPNRKTMKTLESATIS